jgi:predicted amidohydrolase
MLTVENFNVRIVNTGDTYGRNDCLVNDKAKLVEFYDKRYLQDSWMGRGQFVSRYYASTLLKGGCPTGLCLDGRVPEWSVSADGMAQVLDYIKAN